MKNKLENLKEHTVVVADTGDFNAIAKYKPRDATTNPSLIMKAAEDSKYKHLMEEAIALAKKRNSDVIHEVSVKFGLEILKVVPGRVSTEVDPRLSFDLEKSLELARKYIAMYEAAGINRKRILIKLASTWEGIQACKILEQEGIHCNMTLLFNQAQAVACAEASATLISPFVGRIMDYQKKEENRQEIPANEDKGVISVTNIFNYYKENGYKTEIMGASFRNVEEILALAGCDLLTISPDLLEKLMHTQGDVPKILSSKKASPNIKRKIPMDEKTFRWEMNEDAMATEKLSEGIRNFAKDTRSLEKKISQFC
jgi:transaldolase